MSRNSFQELQELHEERYSQRTRETQRKINSSVGLFQFIGDLLELFMPKVFHVFVKASGGDDIDYPASPSAPDHQQDNQDSRYPNT